jgi:hypothetical protein
MNLGCYTTPSGKKNQREGQRRGEGRRLQEGTRMEKRLAS